MLPIKPPIPLFHPFILVATLPSTVLKGRKEANTLLACCSQTESPQPAISQSTFPNYTKVLHSQLRFLPKSKDTSRILSILLSFCCTHGHMPLIYGLNQTSLADGLRVLESLLSAHPHGTLFIRPQTFMDNNGISGPCRPSTSISGEPTGKQGFTGINRQDASSQLSNYAVRFCLPAYPTLLTLRGP